MSDPPLAARACPYCRFPIKGGAATTECPTCGALHHADCWIENRGCAVVGCASASTEPRNTRRLAAVGDRNRQPGTEGAAGAAGLRRSTYVVAGAVALVFVVVAGVVLLSAPAGSLQESAGVITLRVLAPVDGARVTPGAIAVEGTVSPGAAHVEVNGVAAHVGAGHFLAVARAGTATTAIVVAASVPGLAPQRVDLSVHTGARHNAPSRATQRDQTPSYGRAEATSTTVPALGSYYGEAEQRGVGNGINKDFPVEMTFADAADTVSYSSFPCSGTLSRDGSGASTTYTETITSGECESGGTWDLVRLSTTQLSATYSKVGSASGTEYHVYANLFRR